MTDELKQAIQEALEKLRELYRRAEAEGGGFLLNCDIDAEQESAAVEGDTAGLLYFASQLVGLAMIDVRGAHAHFDAWDHDDKLVPDRLIVYKWFPDESSR